MTANTYYFINTTLNGTHCGPNLLTQRVETILLLTTLLNLSRQKQMNSELFEIKSEENIEIRIFVIRGVQAVLDSELQKCLKWKQGN